MMEIWSRYKKKLKSKTIILILLNSSNVKILCESNFWLKFGVSNLFSYLLFSTRNVYFNSKQQTGFIELKIYNYLLNHILIG